MYISVIFGILNGILYYLQFQSLNIRGKIRSGPTYDLLKGKWNDSEVVVKLLKLPRNVISDNGKSRSLR